MCCVLNLGSVEVLEWWLEKDNWLDLTAVVDRRAVSKEETVCLDQGVSPQILKAHLRELQLYEYVYIYIYRSICIEYN